MNDIFAQFKTPTELQLDISRNARALRKSMKLSQSELASRSGVSLGSVKRFEQTGEISLASLLKIALVLRSLDDFDSLFVRREYQSIEEVIHERSR